MNSLEEKNINNNTEDSEEVILSKEVHSMLINPLMGTQMRAWLQKNKDIANKWRGENNETMMHWAFMSHWTFACDLRDYANLSFEDRDNLNRTPLDWLNDRLWFAIVDNKTNHKLSNLSKQGLLQHTIDQIIPLWAQGARSGRENNSFEESEKLELVHPAIVWIRAGAFSLLNLLSEEDTKNLAINNPSLLHFWIFAPESKEKQDFITNWIKDKPIDIEDDIGLTPLAYAVNTYLHNPQLRKSLQPSIKSLIDNGAKTSESLNIFGNFNALNPSIKKDLDWLYKVLTKDLK